MDEDLLIKNSTLKSIADSIREKDKSTEPILVNEFSVRIKAIPSGGSDDETYTGHIDRNGLINQLGWTEEEVNYYQEHGVDWNEEKDSEYLINEYDTSDTPSATQTKYMSKQVAETKIKAGFGLGSYQALKGIPKISLTGMNTLSNKFSSCVSLVTIPEIDTSNIVNMNYAFSGCISLKYLPLLDTSKVTNMGNAFSGCGTLKEIPNISFKSTTSLANTFKNCYSLKKTPVILEHNCTSLYYTFQNCYNLKSVENINTSNMISFDYAFSNCVLLEDIELLDFSNANKLFYTFQNCYKLKNIKGFKDLGKAYLTTSSANYSNYTLDLSASSVITKESLLNIINNLYDIKTKGCATQTVKLSLICYGKLTTEEIEIATNKGWNVTT